MTRDARFGSTAGRNRFATSVAIAFGIAFVAIGVWAMLDPRSFFDTLANFEPYNRHFLQDMGAFQVGLGAVLLIAAGPGHGNALATALLGVGTGAALHTVSHVVGRDLGGAPATDIPTFAVVAVLLLGAGFASLRRSARTSGHG